MAIASVDNEATQQVVVRVVDRYFGLPIRLVREMVSMGAVTTLPHVEGHVRGVMNLRGKVIPVVDLRHRLGIPTLDDEVGEMVAMLEQREQDHRNWLAALERSVEEGEEFKLATDPHKCAFGKWYDAYTTSNLVVANHLKRFDTPHKQIHAIAERCLRLAAEGDREAAREVIEQTRTTVLSRMVDLFAELKRILRETQRSITVVIDAPSGPYALAVDEVTGVEWLAPAPCEGEIEGETEGGDPAMVVAMAHGGDGSRIVSLLDVEAVAGRFVAA
ncbi:MAG: hypothetical protein D6739_11140 [Nitrospirae bacterium]|nr:MAG: hypothetical protein D6739_11140 [Nitrospirota bacterium]